jgi:pyridoxine 5'-phosphate synthase PdxJ
MNKQIKIKLLKNAIRTTLNLITYQINETIRSTEYDMLEIHTGSYNNYVSLLNKVANELELSSMETIKLEAVCQAQVEILLGE